MILPLVIGLDDTWDTKGSHRPVCFPQLGAGSEKRVSLLDYASISVEYKQILKSYFGKQGGLL